MTEKKNILLVVEDEQSLAKAVQDKFTKEGFEVLSAKDGEDGLIQAFEKHPDLILLDIVMPKMDGISMLRKLRDDEWGKDVPVILLTNLSDAEMSKEAVKEKANDYLIKSDWKLEDLVEKIKNALK